MELPLRLRQAVDGALQGVAVSELATATKALSHRYRNEVRDGRLHLSDEKLALAYIATRMPATYAAIHASLAAHRAAGLPAPLFVYVPRAPARFDETAQLVAGAGLQSDDRVIEPAPARGHMAHHAHGAHDAGVAQGRTEIRVGEPFGQA